MGAFKQNRVSATVWPWQATTEPRVRGGDTRREAVVQVAIMWAVALVLFFFVSRPMACIVLGLSVLMLVLGLWFPKAFRSVRRALIAFGSFVGVALTWLLMTPFFYLVFWPANLVLRLKGKDPLQREFPSKADTMWTTHQQRETLTRYERQF